MIDLRPMIIVTGTVRIEGGEKSSVRKQPGSQHRTTNGSKLVVVQEKQITDDRLKADVVTTGYHRRLQRLRLLKTPFGALVDVKHLDKVKEMIQRASTDVAEFNRTHKQSKLANCYLWERLSGNRLEAVRGWIDRQIVEKNPEVVEAMAGLTESAAA